MDMTGELKTKLVAAKSAEEVAELLRADGCEITAEESEKLWEEIGHIREAEDRKLSKDELDAVSAGFGFDFPSGCTLFFSA